MSWRKILIESMIQGAAWPASRGVRPPNKPSSVFILRNNDIGDLLIVTPLFEALKRLYPDARIIAGIGSWNQDVLRNNPWVDQVLPINAPWFNKQICRYYAHSPRGLWDSLRYILTSPEVKQLKQIRCDIGIDVLGSPAGSLLALQAGIPWRLGVKGYAGGYSACQQYVEFSLDQHVGQAALRFAELLGAQSLPEARPQLFLTQPEKDQAIQTWNFKDKKPNAIKRILVAPGGGFIQKCWPKEYYQELVAKIALNSNVNLIIVGSKSDYELGEFVRAGSTAVTNLCGNVSLRDTFALVWAADGVICNSSMVLHVAAAFNRPTAVLLGQYYDSAKGHKKNWGYGTHDLHLGREADRDYIFSVDEVMHASRPHLGLS